MTAQLGFKTLVILTTAGGVALACLELAAAQVEQPPVPAGQAPEVQVRGPVHEAFAEQYNANPTPGIVVTKKPPEMIDEVPPEQMPDGENVVWIPGYWGWDDEAENFLWVSGLWRVTPDGQRWVPGYWTQVDGGHQWASGFWTAAETAELNYQPTPPESLENGANVAAPSEDHFWVPGCWVYGGADYRWRPGYWSVCYEDWVWIPQRYVWTPRGCIFANGYWDYRLPRRGVLFAPLYFHDGYYPGRHYRYSPSIVIALDHLLIHLFVRPSYGHYYFGDYYDDHYARRGFYPWHSYHNYRRHYDPVFAYYNWHYGRRGTDIAGRMRGWHNYFRGHKDFRPPRTLSAQSRFVKHHSGNQYATRSVLSRKLDDHVRRGDTGHVFHRLDDSRRQHWGQATSRHRDLQQTRLKTERSGFAKADGQRGTGHGSAGHPSARLKLPVQSEFRRQTRQSSEGRQVRSPSHRAASPRTSRDISDFTRRRDAGSSHTNREHSGSSSSPRTQGRSSFSRSKGSGASSPHRSYPKTMIPRQRNSGYSGSSRHSVKPHFSQPGSGKAGSSRSGKSSPKRTKSRSSRSGSASTSPSKSHESKSPAARRTSAPAVVRGQNVDKPSTTQPKIAKPLISTTQRSTTRPESSKPKRDTSHSRKVSTSPSKSHESKSPVARRTSAPAVVRGQNTNRPSTTRPQITKPSISTTQRSTTRPESSKRTTAKSSRPSFSRPKSSHSSSSRPSFSRPKSSHSSSSRPKSSRPSFSRPSSSRPKSSHSSSSHSKRSTSRSKSASSRSTSGKSSGSRSHHRKSDSSSRRSRDKKK